MKKINVVELPSGKWKINMTIIRRTYNSPATAYSAVERNLNAFLKATKQLKTSIKVKYRDRSTNETINSGETNYLLYALSCFLEDSLPERTLKRAIRKYALN